MEPPQINWERFNVAEPFTENCDVRTYEDVRRIVARIEAGPFTVLGPTPMMMRDPMYGTHVFCQWKVPNAAKGSALEPHGEGVVVGGHCSIPLPTTERIVLDKISAFLKMMASHEVDEWFKVDGRCHVEPHPELFPYVPPSRPGYIVRTVVVSDYVRPLTPHKAKAERVAKRKFDNELGDMK